MSEARVKLAGEVGAIARHHGESDPRLPELRRELRALSLEEHIRKVVDAAPPLTQDQRNKLAVLLLHSGGDAT
jgi:hypothetical protein